MRFILVFCMTLMMSLSGIADYTLAVFGDSLSNGHKLPRKEAFYAQLEQALQTKGYDVHVLNASKSGETTTGGIGKVQKVLGQKPDGVLLELGINDSFRNTPIPQIKGNLQKLIDTFKANQIPVLLAGMYAKPDKPADYQQQFKKMYQDLATENNLILYPFFMDGIFDTTDIRSFNQSNDNLIPNDMHPNGRGISIMVRGILPTVERFLNVQGIFPERKKNEPEY